MGADDARPSDAPAKRVHPMPSTRRRCHRRRCLAAAPVTPSATLASRLFLFRFASGSPAPGPAPPTLGRPSGTAKGRSPLRRASALACSIHRQSSQEFSSASSDKSSVPFSSLRALRVPRRRSTPTSPSRKARDVRRRHSRSTVSGQVPKGFPISQFPADPRAVAARYFQSASPGDRVDSEEPLDKQ